MTRRPSPERIQAIRDRQKSPGAYWEVSISKDTAINELLIAVDTLTAEREQWGNEFAAVVMSKQERDAWKNYAEKLRKYLEAIYRKNPNRVNQLEAADMAVEFRLLSEEALALPRPGE